jgi:hypothetical protein
MRLRIGGSLVALVLLGACSTTPQPSAPSPHASAPTTPTPDASTTPAPTALIEVPTPARPYTALQVLAAMGESRRPGGVPDELETETVAGALAAGIWTYDGQPYPLLVIGGSCGPDRCTLEASGTPAGGAGSDLYAFTVIAETGATELLETDLHGYPAELDAILDAVARDGLDPTALSGLALAGATWLPPPEAGTFRARYRSGGEEASPGLDLLVDLLSGRILETIPR